LRWRSRPWTKRALLEYQDLIIDDPGRCMAGAWRELFGRDGPLHVELGTGKGRFLAEMALAFPEVNFVGIERHREVLAYAARNARERSAANVRFAVADVAALADRLFAPGEIDRLYINFCDPWPKARHAKRRLTHLRFLALYRQVIRPGGELILKTDNEALFDFSLAQFAAAGLVVRHISRDLGREKDIFNIMTEYEQKFTALGLPIFRAEVMFP